MAKYFTRLIGQDVSIGALPTLRAATEAGLKGAEYFGPDGFLGIRGYPVKVSPSKLSKDKEIAAKLWTVSEELTGVKFEFNKNLRAICQS